MYKITNRRFVYRTTRKTPMKKVLYIGPDIDTATDGNIVSGVFELFGKFEHISKYVYLVDSRKMEDSEFFPEFDADLVVVMGTPWLWDNFQYSIKYKHLLQCFNFHPRAKKLFAGIGTCVDLGAEKSGVLKTPPERYGIRKLFSNAKVMVRDSLSLDFLKNAGIEGIFLNCPSYYLTNPNPIEYKYPVLFYVDPLNTISHEYWRRNPDKLAEYNNIVQTFYHKYSPKVFCARIENVESANNLGFKDVEVVPTLSRCQEICAEGSFFLSGRVHCGVPAYRLGKPVGILPIDSRAQTLTDFGCQAIKTVDDLKYFENINPRPASIMSVDFYHEIIKEMLK